MSKKLGARARVRERTIRGSVVFEVLVYPRHGPPTSTSYPTRAEAERQCRIAAAAIQSGAVDAPATWAEAIDAFIADRAKPRRRCPEGARWPTLDAYRRHLTTVGRVLGADDLDPLALSVRDGERFVELRRQEKTPAGKLVSPATIVDELEVVTIMQRLFVEKEWIARATWSEVPRPEILASTRALKPDEIGRFIRVAERLGEDPAAATAEISKTKKKSERRKADWERWPAAAWLLMHAICTGELEHLLVGDIDLVTGYVEVVDRAGARTKRRARHRTVMIMVDEALLSLRRTFAGRPPGEPAFNVHTRTPAHGGERRYKRTNWFAERCRITCELAGIEPVSPHELRHTVATLAILAGADADSLAAMLGQKKLVRTYVHATQAEKSMAAAKVVSGALARVIAAHPPLRVVKAS